MLLEIFTVGRLLTLSESRITSPSLSYAVSLLVFCQNYQSLFMKPVKSIYFGYLWISLDPEIFVVFSCFTRL